MKIHDHHGKMMSVRQPFIRTDHLHLSLQEAGETRMNVIDYSNINRGTRGIFEDIEKQANNFTSKCLILMAVISIFLIVMHRTGS